MSDTKTSTSSTAPSNPNVTATVNKLLSGVNSAYDRGPKTFNESLVPGAGQTTQNAWASSLAAAGNPAFANGISGALESFGRTASGANIGQKDPGYAAVRGKLVDDVTTNNLDAFNSSGMFGSDSNRKSLASGLSGSLGALDMQQYNQSLDRQQQAAAALPGLFNAGQLPSAIQGAVGTAQDANSAAVLAGRKDLFDRQNNAQTDYLAKLSSILASTGQSNNTTTSTTSPATPWWQGLLSLGIGAL